MPWPPPGAARRAATSAGNYLYIRERQKLVRSARRGRLLAVQPVRRRRPGARARRGGDPRLPSRCSASAGPRPGVHRRGGRSRQRPRWSCSATGSSRGGSAPIRSWSEDSVRLSGVTREVIGVMPAALGLRLPGEQLWVPIAFTPERRAMHDEHFLTLLGRLRPGVTPRPGPGGPRARRPRPRARSSARQRGPGGRRLSAARRRGRRLPAAAGRAPGRGGPRPSHRLRERGQPPSRRGSARERELAMRASLGAGRGRTRPAAPDGERLLGGLAASVGVLVAEIGRRLLVATAPAGVPRLEAARVDAGVLAFAVVVGLVSSVVFGLAPALQLSQRRPAAGPRRRRAHGHERRRPRPPAPRCSWRRRSPWPSPCSSAPGCSCGPA